ncbi:ABC transporter permease [Microbacterium sp. P5_E9]
MSLPAPRDSVHETALEQQIAAAAPVSAFRRRGHATLVIGLILTGAIIVTALVSLVWLPYSLSDISGGRLEGPNATHLLGTDRLGRDLLSQLMVGARIALIVGAGAALLAGTIGTLVGLAAALARPWVDDTLSATLDVVIAFPVLLLAMLIVAVQGASLGSAIFAIGLAMAAVIARLTRILARRVLQEQFVTAARTSGTRLPGIVGRHILPNIAPTLAVALALQFGVAVLAEASLSYLGLGAPPPNASWGRMLQEAQGTVLTAPVGALAPGVAIVALVLGVNFLADGLRERADPTRRRAR